MLVYNILILIFLLSLVILSFTKFKNKKKFIIFTTLVLIVINLSMLLKLGFLWIYYPLHIFTLIWIALCFLDPSQKKSATLFTFLKVFLIIFLVVFAFVVVLFPIKDVPKPSGKYLVGTKTYTIVDEDRLEKYNDLGENRKFKIQLWYPSDTVTGLERAYWLDAGKPLARAMAKDATFPDFLFTQLAKVKSNAYMGAKLSEDLAKYPIVIISHGWRGSKSLHADMAEELASNGYIVVGIDHTYGAVSTRIGDKVLSINYDALPVGLKGEKFMKKANQLVNTYADDVIKTIDFLEDVDKIDDSFKNRLDLENIGLLGHSTGGGAGVRVALKDERVKALIGMDAWVEPIKKENISIGLRAKSMFFRSDWWQDIPNNENLALLYEASHSKPIFYQVGGTSHYDFAMIYMYSPAIKWLGYSGKVDTDLLIAELKEAILNFFDKTLYDKKTKFDVNKYENMEEIIILKSNAK